MEAAVAGRLKEKVACRPKNRSAADSRQATCERAHTPVHARSLCCAALKFWSPRTPKGQAASARTLSVTGPFCFLVGNRRLVADSEDMGHPRCKGHLNS